MKHRVSFNLLAGEKTQRPEELGILISQLSEN